MVGSLFEGPEKKVELVLQPGAPSFRDWPEAEWRRIVGLARATVLSKVSNTFCDAYLLSESSLIVYPHQVVMITCGRTRLVRAVKAMLDRVPADAVGLLIYERKNEHFPAAQPSTFEQDASELQAILPGRALGFGRPGEHRIQLFHSAALDFSPRSDDMTLEILMHGIAEDTLEVFRHASFNPRHVVRESLGSLLEGGLIDDHLFAPAGYSLNALQESRYTTLHVTPQSVGSYVSFETNVDLKDDPERIIAPVLRLFRPTSFDLFSFSPSGSVTAQPSGYGLRDHVSCELNSGYKVSFQNFSHPVGQPRPPEEIPLDAEFQRDRQIG